MTRNFDPFRHKILLLSCLLILNGCIGEHKDADKKVFESETARFVIDTIVSNLKRPNSMDWLPDGRAIFTERLKVDSGMSLLGLETGEIIPICAVPQVFRTGDGGMMDVYVHPDFFT